jgi:hypothetical protein
MLAAPPAGMPTAPLLTLCYREGWPGGAWFVARNPGRTAHSEPSGACVLLSVQVAGGGWGGGLLVMRRSGVRFPKAAQFKVLISLVCSHGSPACLGHEGDVPRLIVGDMRSRRVSPGGSLLVNGRWDHECSNPIPVLRGRRGCSWLPGLVPECRRRPVVVTHHAGLYSGACIASPSAAQVHERPPGAPWCQYARPSSCRSGASTLVAGPQQAVYLSHVPRGAQATPPGTERLSG